MVEKRHIRYYLAGLISLVTIVAYLSSLRNGFVSWDDRVYIYDNEFIRSFNFDFLKGAFCRFYVSNWHPLTWISHAVDYALWGLNPLGHHLTSILLHAVNTFLVVLLSMTFLHTAEETRYKNNLSIFFSERSILLGAGVTGLLFGLHPLHVESVAWASERKDLLCALFFLLSILNYVKYISARNKQNFFLQPACFLSNKYYLLSLIFFILALLSKPMAVTLPVVLLLLDWYPFRRVRSIKDFIPVLFEKLPLIVLSLLLSIITILAQQSAMLPMDRVPLLTRVFVAASSLVAYLWKMMVPLNLIPLYPYPQKISILSFQYLSSVAIVIAITVIAIIILQKQKVWLAVWGYYLITLVPVIGIVQVGGQAMADRYVYLPSIGPFFLMGLGAAWISVNILSRQRKGVIIQRICVIVAIVYFVTLGYLTVKQTGVWRNSIIFWTYVVEKVSRPLPIAYLNRGFDYLRIKQYDKAIQDFDQAIVLNASYTKAYYNRGFAYVKKGWLDEAIKDFNKTIDIDPSYAEAYNIRGKLWEEKGQPRKAIEDYQKAISLQQSNPEAYFNLGVLYGKTGSREKAIDYLNKSITLNPKNADYYSNRGAFYIQQHQYDNALKDLNKALQINRDMPVVYYNRGIIYLNTGRKELANEDFRKACSLGDQDGCRAL